MIGALIRARRQRTLNYLRYHLDAGTLVRLALVAVLLLFLGGNPASTLGGWLARMQRPGFGAAWFQVVLWASPLLALYFFQQARAVRRPSREAHLLFVSGAAAAGMERWAILQQLERTILPILLSALPTTAPVGTAAPLLRGAALITGLVALSLVVLRLTPPSHQAVAVPSPARRRVSSALIGGGPLRSLVMRDLVHLARRSRGTFVLMTAAALVEFLVARSMSTGTSGAVALLVTHVLVATLVVNMLMGLFERDVTHAGLLRALPISGRRFWLARGLLAWVLSSLPAFPGMMVLGASGQLSLVVGLALVSLSLPLAILYANVGVALFPRTTLAGFVLNMAVALLVVSWFLAPLATLAVAALTLGLWSMRAPRAFDNWEAA